MPSIAPQAVPPRDAAQQLGAMKLGRILTAITIAILVGSMFAYETVKQNDIAYQSHPMVCVITDFFSSSLVGLIFYFGSGWIARRKARQANKATAAFPEDRYYDQVARELRNKTLIPGLWTKAYAEANGDEAKARALYIKYRVAQLASLG